MVFETALNSSSLMRLFMLMLEANELSMELQRLSVLNRRLDVTFMVVTVVIGSTIRIYNNIMLGCSKQQLKE